MAIDKPDNIKDRDKNAFFYDDDNGSLSTRRVSDKKTHDLLQTLGGSTNTTTSIFNISVPLANTEVSQQLPNDTKGFTIRNRENGKLKLAFTSGESGTNYITISPGSTYVNRNLYSSLTVYFQSTKGSQVVEIEAHV